MAVGRRASPFQLSRIGLPLMVVVAGLLCTALAAFQLRSAVEQAERQRFETLASERLDLIDDRLDTYVTLLRGVVGLFAAAPDVSRDEFFAFVQRLRLPQLYAGVQGVGFARAVQPQERETVAAEMRARGVADFEIRPPGERDLYSSIVFLEPQDRRNQAALGFDMFSEPIRRAAMEQARDTGLRAASGKVILAQEIDQDKQPGFLIYIPVYNTPLGMVPPTVEERRAHINGWVYSPFRAYDLFSRALEIRGRKPELHISIYDGTEAAEEHLLYRTDDSQPAGAYRTVRTLNIAEHNWTLVFENTTFFAADSNRGFIPYVAAGGVLATFLLFAAAMMQTRVTAIAEDAREQLTEMNASLEGRVEERTAQLESARSALETLNRNLETIVESRTADLQAANDEIQRFAYIVSHDLRAPLVNVMGFTSELQVARDAITQFYADLIKKAPEAASPEMKTAIEAELPEAIEFIRASTVKMDRLINAILRLSREGGRVLTPEPIDMKALLENTVQSLNQQITTVGAEVVIEPVPTLTSDRLALEQIFTNLLENAVKYLAPERPGKIRVRGWQEGSTVFVDVEDNGRGIDPKDHSRVFDLFRRAGAQDRPGEGIGLAHVRALVRRLGGTITLNSMAGEGSTFRVSLPSKMKKTDEGEI